MSVVTKFSWKRKIPHLSKFSNALSTGGPFNENDLETVDDYKNSSIKRSKLGLNTLEDVNCKAVRLRSECCYLAENQRYAEALKKLDEALSLLPYDAVLYEYKAQILMEIAVDSHVFDGIVAAEKSVSLNAMWYCAHQTLGRAQMIFGEIVLALKSFEKAVILAPWDMELRVNDLLWCHNILQQAKSPKLVVNDHCKTIVP